MSNNIKTKVTDKSAADFIGQIENTTKREDSLRLLEIYERVTMESPRMWGNGTVGFGQYHYKSDRSRQEGDWPLAGFAPRKQHLTLYIMLGFGNYTELLDSLGKHKTSVSCLYINKLSDVNIDALERLIKQSYLDAKKTLVS
jgi:hypothetical protein